MAFINKVHDLMKFIDKSASPFHAVEQIIKRLLKEGFVEIHERNKFQLKLKRKYFFTRNRSTIIAFAIGGMYEKGNGFNIIGCHTDSPCLKLKPISKLVKASYDGIVLGVQTYGGGMWHTWFDRDLKLAGRVIIEKNLNDISHQLVHINSPILRIPTLAIHLQRELNTEGFKFNLENDLIPIGAINDNNESKMNKFSNHSEHLLMLLSQNLNCEGFQLTIQIIQHYRESIVNEIVDFELCLSDFNNATIGGLKQEFLFSSRIDNLLSCFCAVEALVNSTCENLLNQEKNVQMISFFDNEEVGSNSAYGAGSTLLNQTISRIGDLNLEEFNLTILRSVLLSVDMAHAVHPTFSDKHEVNHKPNLNGGIVIKHNSNQRYATTSITSSIVKNLAKLKNIPIQEICVRNDSPCGSTIGPILSTNLGIRTVDIGVSQLSMHSIREMCGINDIDHLIFFLTSFFESISVIESHFVFD